jgi:hypothetical protein
MEYIPRRQADRIKIDVAAAQQLTGEIYIQSKDFLDFIRNEEINTPWKSIYGYNMKYGGRVIGGITLLGGDSSEGTNHVQIGVAAASDGKSYDKYLDGLPDDLTMLFMERIANKCSRCRPGSMCAEKAGMTVTIHGKRHKNVCCLSNGFLFNNHNENMDEMILSNQGGTNKSSAAAVSLDTVKALILAAKRFVEKVYMN